MAPGPLPDDRYNDSYSQQPLTRAMLEGVPAHGPGICWALALGLTLGHLRTVSNSVVDSFALAKAADDGEMLDNSAAMEAVQLSAKIGNRVWEKTVLEALQDLGERGELDGEMTSALRELREQAEQGFVCVMSTVAVIETTIESRRSDATTLTAKYVARASELLVGLREIGESLRCIPQSLQLGLSAQCIHDLTNESDNVDPTTN